MITTSHLGRVLLAVKEDEEANATNTETKVFQFKRRMASAVLGRTRTT